MMHQGTLPVSSPIQVGVIGLGFMGRTHVGAFQNATGSPCRLAAVADARVREILNGAATAGNLTTSGSSGPLVSGDVRTYTRAEELLADPGIHAISICTPTDTHVDLALAALAAGKHILLEKPVAVRSADVARVREAAAKSGKVCMPAMVMRFWPGWEWLHDRIRDRSLGNIRSAEFDRRGSRPTWNTAFYSDESRSGGALVDLHIHDADFALWCFGMPSAVTSVGSVNQVTTIYHYPADSSSPALVTASGGWGQSPGFGFRMRYTANFENATADFDLARGEKPVLMGDATESRPIELPTLSGYDAEIRHFVDVVANGTTPKATLQDAFLVAKLLEAERESLRTRTTITIR